MRFKIKQANSVHCILLLLSITLQHIELTPSLLAVYPNIFYQKLQSLIKWWNPNSECTKAEVPNQEIIYSKIMGRSYRFFTLSFRTMFLFYGRVHTISNLKELWARRISISFMLKITVRWESVGTLPNGLGGKEPPSNFYFCRDFEVYVLPASLWEGNFLFWRQQIWVQGEAEAKPPKKRYIIFILYYGGTLLSVFILAHNSSASSQTWHWSRTLQREDLVEQRSCRTTAQQIAGETKIGHGWFMDVIKEFLARWFLPRLII